MLLLQILGFMPSALRSRLVDFADRGAEPAKERLKAVSIAARACSIRRDSGSGAGAYSMSHTVMLRCLRGSSE